MGVFNCASLKGRSAQTGKLPFPENLESLWGQTSPVKQVLESVPSVPEFS